MFETPDDGDAKVPTYEHQVKCPNARNLIAVIGDSLADPDRACDQKCNLLIEGMGRRPKDVLIEGDRLKKDVIRADRADGFFLRNVWVEQGAFNDVDVVETNGFRLRKLVTPYGQNYGVLSFASDNGLYEHIEAFGNGDSGIYPGSGPEGHCQRYGIEIRNVNSHHNVLGYSGTAGNGTWTRNSKFHHNNAGISDDSFASGHPGMPQDCSKWTANQVYSNNENYFTNDRDAYCKNTPFEKRKKEIVCPQFQVPVGSGFILYGVNSNLIQDNAIYDNWRSGVRLFWVPARCAVRTTRRSSSTPPTTTGSSATRWGSARTTGARPTASTSSGTSRASATAGSATRRPAARSRAIPATLPQCPRARSSSSRHPGQDRRRGALRRLGSGDAAGPARLHLVHHPAQAAAMRWAIAATVLLLAGVGGLLLAGTARRDAGGDRQRAAGVEGQAEPDPRPVAPARPHPHGQHPQRLAAGRRPRVRARADPRRRRAPPEGDRVVRPDLLPRSLPVVDAGQGLGVRAPADRQDRHDQAGAGRAADALLARGVRRLGARRGPLRRRQARASWLVSRACQRIRSMPAPTSRSAARPTRSSGSTRCSRSSTWRGCPSR